MRPLFTIHGGEYLVGSHIERKFRRVNVWLPARDTGIDLLITNRHATKRLSLQAKFSKDFLVTHMNHMDPVFQKELRACGWWTINRDKLRNSSADVWIFVLHGFGRRTVDFVVVPRKELWRRLQSIHGRPRIIQCYLWVTERKCCWETRGLLLEDKLRIASGRFHHKHRDFTKWLNNWGPVEKLNK